MGQGAYVKIGNASNQTIEVGYWGFNCMYQNGSDGSDFGPITSMIPPGIPPGTSLPASGTQYIEADGSGSCALQASSFNMNFNVFNPDEQSATFAFSEAAGIYSVDGNSWSTHTAGGVTFLAVIGSNAQMGGNGQAVISIIAY